MNNAQRWTSRRTFENINSVVGLIVLLVLVMDGKD